MSAVGDARKRTQQTPAGTLTDTEREARMDRLSPLAITVAEEVWSEDEPTLAEYELAGRIVAAALAPIEALAAEWSGKHGRPESWWRIGAELEAALAGGGDRD